jgi:hypothetical protein
MSKKYLNISQFFLFICFFITSAFAFEDNKKEFGLYFGSKIYEERHPVDNSFFMSQDGYMMGLLLNDETYDDEIYTGFKTRLAAGEVDYQSNGTGTMSGIPDYQFETTGYLGFRLGNSNDSRTTLFSGFGFRYLLNASGLKQSSTGHSGYDRESRYLYMPFGLNYEIDNWEIRGEYLYFIYGQQTSKISQVSSNYSDITNDQEDGSGIKLTVKNYLENNFGVEFYMDYWDIADSELDVSGNFMEPRNTTTETGLRVFWSY